jgi:molybdopterin molybdotransferase
MITSEQASLIIGEHMKVLPIEEIPFLGSAGRVLREPILADREVPPFDRVMMDGIAFSHRSWAAGNRRFKVAGVHPAGEPARVLPHEDACFEIMTGAVLLEGCDCVVPYEEISITEGYAEVVTNFLPEAGKFIHRRGSDHPRGDPLVEAGRRLTAREIACAAACGYAKIKVTQQPRVTLVSTGDELVDFDQPVKPHEIRSSNAYALLAALSAMGIPDARNRHLRDDRDALENSLREILDSSEVVILSGGISKGKFDFVPEILAKLGVERLFHGVSQRPGKPFWYGVRENGATVFALPGNPLSTVVCFHRYVAPAIERMLGLGEPPEVFATLAEGFHFKPPLTLFLPVLAEFQRDGHLSAEPQPANNSGDYAAIVPTDGFVELPGESQTEFAAGFAARYFPWL